MLICSGSVTAGCVTGTSTSTTDGSMAASIRSPLALYAKRRICFRTGPLAPPTSTVPRTAAMSSMPLSRYVTYTRFGVAVGVPATYPSAGSPVTSMVTGISRTSFSSMVTVTLEGNISTSTCSGNPTGMSCICCTPLTAAPRSSRTRAVWVVTRFSTLGRPLTRTRTSDGSMATSSYRLSSRPTTSMPTPSISLLVLRPVQPVCAGACWLSMWTTNQSSTPSASATTLTTLGFRSHLSIIARPPFFPERPRRLVLPPGFRSQFFVQLGDQRFFLDVPHDLSVHDERHLPRLLGHDDADGVGHFGQPDRRPVPRAEFPADERVFRQGQIAPGRRDGVPPDDDGAVMERGVRNEQVDQQLRADDGADRRAGFHVVRQPGLPLEHDERPDPLPGHAVDRPDHVRQLLRIRVGVIDRPGKQLAPAQLFQHPPQFRLENDDERQHAEG